jgi:hypothetical protein
VRLRLTSGPLADPFRRFESLLSRRQDEADAFYADLQAGIADEDVRTVQRQAFAGMIWSKQFFYYDVPEWLKGDPAQPPPPAQRRHSRNSEWLHLNNAEVISMPDKWEYPWYAAWDLAFHMIPFALIDPEFAKAQLVLLTREWYMHPNGQLPAYEWAFSDVNPPVHAWATWRVFQIDRKQRGDCGDLAFLERVFHKLMLNFTWWVNRKDGQGRNIFQGGFLGLDNIVLKAKHASGTLNGNTYAQALATALNAWVTTTGLGWNTSATGPQHYGFKQACLGGLCYNMGNNGASFHVDNDTMQTVSYCMCCLDCMTTASADGGLTNLPTTLYFYNNDPTLTNGANIVLNGINESGDIN